MASFNLDSLTVNPRILGADEFGVVFRNGNIAAVSDVAVTSVGAATIRNGGAISSIHAAGIEGHAPGLAIDNTGTITGGTHAIKVSPGVLESELYIVSSGSIHAISAGYSAIEIDGHAAMIVNTGEIISLGGHGIAVTPVGWSPLVTPIFNGGKIYARGEETWAIKGGGGSEEIENAGSISGGIHTGSGADTITNSGLITGTIDLSNGHDVYEGRTGEALSKVIGGAGNDSLRAGHAGEYLTGNDGHDTLRGGAGNDTLEAGPGADIVIAGAGDDTLFGGDDNDALWGGIGHDQLDGGLGQDGLYGGQDDDTIRGGGGRDTLKGGRGDDELEGGEDADRLKGGQGADTLTGGDGEDVFVVTPNGGADQIVDFTLGEDRLDLVAFGLSGFSDLTSTYSLDNGSIGARIDFGDATVVVLSGVIVMELDSGDFLF